MRSSKATRPNSQGSGRRVSGFDDASCVHLFQLRRSSAGIAESFQSCADRGQIEKRLMRQVGATMSGFHCFGCRGLS